MVENKTYVCDQFQIVIAACLFLDFLYVLYTLCNVLTNPNRLPDTAI